MTNNDFNGQAFAWFAGALVLFLGLWGFFKTFATQKDFDDLKDEVDALKNNQQADRILIARLETTIGSLERAVRDLTKLLRQQITHNHIHPQGASCPSPLPYIAARDDGSHD